LAAKALAALPDDSKNLKSKHIKKACDVFRLENHEIPIKDVVFEMHHYNHYI
jgi:hypothetical protein